MTKFSGLQIAQPLMHVFLQDMTSRELLQQRTTLPNGDTSWRLSPLVTASREGRLAVLDGIHRLDAGTLGVLKRFVKFHCRSVDPLLRIGSRESIYRSWIYVSLQVAYGP